WVLLTGLGGDPDFSASFLFYLKNGPQFSVRTEWIRNLVSYAVAEGRISRLYLRTHWRRLNARIFRSARPEWFLGADGGRYMEDDPQRHPYRPHAYTALHQRSWTYTLEDYDPQFTSYPIEVRHP